MKLRIMQNWHEYWHLKSQGYTPEQIYAQAQLDGVSFDGSIRLVRYLFDLDLVEAKEVMVRAKGWASRLAEHQENLFRSITEDQWRQLLG
jgi:hypothetical protein